MSVPSRVVGALQVFLGAVDGYLLLLLAAATRAPTMSEASTGDASPIAVLMPAHDEETSVGRAVVSLLDSDLPTRNWTMVVIADNCSDQTAQVARESGAVVLERADHERRGKGHALNWALDRLDEVAPTAKTIVFVDADCEVSPNLLSALESRVRSGAVAAQASYAVANPGASSGTSLRAAAFALMNHVRPLGKDRLGLSVGLFGTGMAVRRDLIATIRFDPSSIVEDADVHLRLVAAGERVVFVAAAEVRSAMPTRAGAAEDQQRRWEGGRLGLLQRWFGPLLGEGLRRRDLVRMHAALELLVPPQTLLAVLHVLSVSAGVQLGRRTAVFGLLEFAAQVVFVLGGLRTAGAPPSAFRALAASPALIIQKLGVFGRIARAGAPTEWQRTARD